MPATKMNSHQRFALEQPCYLAFETAAPRYRYVLFGHRMSIVLTVNAGHE